MKKIVLFLLFTIFLFGCKNPSETIQKTGFLLAEDTQDIIISGYNCNDMTDCINAMKVDYVIPELLPILSEKNADFSEWLNSISCENNRCGYMSSNPYIHLKSSSSCKEDSDCGDNINIIGKKVKCVNDACAFRYDYAFEYFEMINLVKPLDMELEYYYKKANLTEAKYKRYLQTCSLENNDISCDDDFYYDSNRIILNFKNEQNEQVIVSGAKIEDCKNQLINIEDENGIYTEINNEVIPANSEFWVSFNQCYDLKDEFQKSLYINITNAMQGQKKFQGEVSREFNKDFKSYYNDQV